MNRPELSAEAAVAGILRELRSQLLGQPQAMSLIDRLAKDRIARRLLKEVHSDGKSVAGIVLACIEAHELLLNFTAFVTHERALLGNARAKGELKDLETCVSRLRTFIVTEVNQQPKRPMTAGIYYDAKDERAIYEGLHRLEDAVKTRRRTAEENLRRCGVTRKVQGKAAETAAIGWLATGIERVVGRADFNLTSGLAQSIIGQEVSVFRAREAKRTHQRDWRKK